MDTLSKARRRLVFDEFFQFILYMQLQKEQGQKIENIFTFRTEDILTPLLAKLPYTLTAAQLRVLEEIQKDLHGQYIMQRLIQGDVGSGKTIVAFLAMYLVSASGYQSALMAPTEVLASQHYETFAQYIELFGIKTHLVLLTGAMTAKQKRRAYERMQLFKDAMVIGTHALFQEKAAYDNLALVITDEQHRFGVVRKGVCGRHPAAVLFRQFREKRIPRFPRRCLEGKTLRPRVLGNLYPLHIKRNPIFAAHGAYKLLVPVALLTAQAMVKMAGADFEVPAGKRAQKIEQSDRICAARNGGDHRVTLL